MRITLNLLISTIFLFCSFSTNGQSKDIEHLKSEIQVVDSTKTVHLLKKSLLPISLIGLGTIVNNSSFEKQLQIDLRDKVGNDYEFLIGNYLQYMPIAEMYIANVIGVKAKNHWFDQTKYLLISNLISTTITQSLKRITNKTRPNGDPYSFPSGHTTFAFTNATVLKNEFHKSAPILAYSGYAIATTTGVFRMINNKHALSDVLVGAGVGILITEVVYHFEPFKSYNPFIKTENISLIPQINDQTYGFYFAYHF